MASVQHYVCDSDHFPVHIIEKQTALQDIEKDRHYAALKIQRVYRGYMVRKEVAIWHRAATIIQKYFRGFLLRWHLPQILKEYIDWNRRNYYDQMATRIQACWRGYWGRKNKIPMCKVMEMRAAVEKANSDIQQEMRKAFESMEKNKSKQMEREAEKWVLYILFKLHHLVRTHVQEGIYSLHGQTNDSWIEGLLKVLPLQRYMKELKKAYYREIKKEKPPRTYTFKTKYLQNTEDNYKIRNRSHERKESKAPFAEFIFEHSKPFDLYKRLTKKPYERLLLYNAEKYSDKKLDIFERTENKAKHISEKDFDLHVLKKVMFELRPPPYYPDLWTKTCDIHNIPDI